MEAKPGEQPANLEGEDLDSSPEPAVDSSKPSEAANPDKASEKKPGDKRDDKKEASGESLLARIRGWRYLYLLLFAILLLVVGGSVGAALLLSKDSSEGNQPQELTTDQLAELSGTATTVGDSQQILSIRSSTIFEGQVLAKNDFSVAGTLKIGGPLSIPTLDVGSGTFDKLQVDTDVTVGGSQSIQGNLTVQGSLSISGTSSFQNLSVGALNASSLQLAGDLTINRHLVASGGSPSKSNGPALGGGGTASVSGSDTAGTIGINTGNSPPSGCFVSIDFASDFNGSPAVVVTPVGSAGASLDYYVNRSSAGFSLCTASVPPSGASFSFDYIVIN